MAVFHDVLTGNSTTIQLNDNGYFIAANVFNSISWICLFANMALFMIYWKKLQNSLNILLCAATFSELARFTVELIFNSILISTGDGSTTPRDPSGENDHTPDDNSSSSNGSASSVVLSAISSSVSSFLAPPPIGEEDPLIQRESTCRFSLATVVFMLTLSSGFMCFYYMQIPIILANGEASVKFLLKIWFILSVSLAIGAGIWAGHSIDMSKLVEASNTQKLCHTSASGVATDFIVPTIFTIVTAVCMLMVVFKLVRTRRSLSPTYGSYLTARTAYVGIVVVASICITIGHVLGQNSSTPGLRRTLVLFGIYVNSLNGIWLLLLFIYTEGMWRLFKRYRKQKAKDQQKLETTTESAPLRRNMSMPALCENEDTLVSGDLSQANLEQFNSASSRMGGGAGSTTTGTNGGTFNSATGGPPLPTTSGGGGGGFTSGNSTMVLRGGTGGGTGAGSRPPVTGSMLVTSPVRVPSGLTEQEEQFRWFIPEVDFSRETLSGIVCNAAVEVLPEPEGNFMDSAAPYKTRVDSMSIADTESVPGDYVRSESGPASVADYGSQASGGGAGSKRAYYSSAKSIPSSATGSQRNM